MVVSATELRKNIGKYLRMVQNGQIILITKFGKPVAKLVPIDKGKQRELYAKEMSDAAKDKDFIDRTMSSQKD